MIGGATPPDERKAGKPMYVTYSDLIQIGILLVALANLVYQIHKGKNSRPLPAIADGCLEIYQQFVVEGRPDVSDFPFCDSMIAYSVKVCNRFL